MKNSNSQHQGLLLFKLTERQSFAIGTLKVREIVPFQPLTNIPQSHRTILGSTPIRGKTMPIIDLAAAVGSRALAKEELSTSFIIITDCQRQLIGFAVRGIERIIERSWKDISAPPSSVGNKAFVSGVTQFEDKMVQLLDVEQLLSIIFPTSAGNLLPHISEREQSILRRCKILVVDDSAVARKQLAGALDFADVPFEVCSDGQHALDAMVAASNASEPFDILVSDVEMPGLDGYELTFEVRSNPALAKAYIIVHTSLSSEISVDRAHQVGANEALTKFDADELIHAMLRGAEKVEKGDVKPGVENHKI
jgi:two-component system chemotaxis response regulator CheV